MYKIVFFGTPEYAIPSLELLRKHHKIILVITQPDKATGRGQKIIAPLVKTFALTNNLEVRQSIKISQDLTLIDELKYLKPDFFVTAAFGQILSSEILEVPKFGTLNVHASLLPKWRGASPIQSAILNGDKETGITIMLTNQGLDTGDILKQKKILIEDTDDNEILTKKLSQLGADLLIETLDNYENISPIVQDNSQATYAKKITKELRFIDLEKETGETIIRRLRALSPSPKISFSLELNKKISLIKIISAEFLKEKSIDSNLLDINNNKIFKFNNNILVKCKDGFIKLIKVQPQDKNIMNAEDWFRGIKF